MDDRSVHDISQLVQTKERELHEAHEHRCSHLEKMIEERDSLLQESTKRFNSLREDFQYNLSLLEARDKEIGRLSQVEIRLEACEQEKDNLTKRIEMMVVKECDKDDKTQQDKIMNKKILIELQSEVESLRWTTSDELKAKARDIEQSRQEIKRIQAEREESFERQRVELTELYENVLREREIDFRSREDNICQQVQLLEKRFQSLTNENTRLKSDRSQLQRTCEKVGNDAASKEERCNQLLWQVDDCTRKLQETEDTLYKKIQDMEAENQSYQNTLDQMAIESKRELNKAASERKREKEFSTLKITHWEELHAKNTTEIENLTENLSVAQDKGSLLARELESAREKTRNFGVKEMELKAEIDEQKRQVESRELSVLKLQEELQGVKMKYTQLQDMFAHLESTSKDQLRNATEHMQGMQADMAVMRANLEAEHIVMQEENEKPLQQEIDSLKQRVEECAKQLEDKNEECRGLIKALGDEKAEAAAMQLRLQLQQASTDGATTATSMANPALNIHIPQTSLSPGFHGDYDYGTVSIPGSPAVSASPFFHGEKINLSRGGFPTNIASPTPRHTAYTPHSRPLKSKDDLDILSLSPTSHATESYLVQQKKSSLLMSEDEHNDNKRLKTIIKEMRIDAEALYDEMKKAVAERDKATELVAKLQDHLLQATREVNKLRGERQGFMDANNELKTCISALRMEASRSAEEQKEDDSHESDESSLYSSKDNCRARSSGRASDKQTKSQQDALQSLKEKNFTRGSTRYGNSTSNNSNNNSQHPVRKVVNYNRLRGATAS